MNFNNMLHFRELKENNIIYYLTTSLMCMYTSDRKNNLVS